MSPPPAGARKARQVSAIYHTNGAMAKTAPRVFESRNALDGSLTAPAPLVPRPLLAEAFFFFILVR